MLLTFIVVVIAWVFFRAHDLDAALCILKGLAGVNGLTIPEWPFPRVLVQTLNEIGVNFGELAVFKDTPGGINSMVAWVTALLALVWLAPNTQQIMVGFKPILETVKSTSRVCWQPNRLWMMITVVGLVFALLRMGRVSEFLYFQF